MESLKVSEMWQALQKADRLPATQTLAGAESELQELMRQIDIMVTMRKREWEREKHGMLGRLEAREAEVKVTQATLSQRHEEVGQLRGQLDTVERSRADDTQRYETTLGTLREEVAAMKKDYDRLHRKYSRHVKDAQREKGRVTSSTEETTAEIAKLNTKLEDYRQRARTWDARRREYETKIEEMSGRTRDLEELCQRSKLEKQNGLDSTELSLKQQIAHLENQVDRARETIATQDSQNLRLKASLDEASTNQRALQESRDKLAAEVGKKMENIKDLQRHLEESVRNHSGESPSSGSEAKLRTELLKMRDRITKRDAQIKELKAQSVRGQLDQVCKLEVDLLAAKAELEKCEESERSAREEVTHLQQTLDKAQRENAALHSHLSGKMSEVASSEKTSYENYRCELSKLVTDANVRSESHRGEIEGMKREMSIITTELHDRNVAMATMSEKMAALERQSREHHTLLDEKQLQIEVTNAQLEATKAENRQLRRLATSFSDDSDATTSGAGHNSLEELQKAYTTAIKALEKQNAQYHSDLSSLRSQLSAQTETSEGRLQRALEDSQRTIQTLQEREERRLSEVQEKSNRRVKFLEDQLRASTDRYQGYQSAQLELSQLGDGSEQLDRSVTYLHSPATSQQSPRGSSNHDNSLHSNHSNPNSTRNEISANLDADMEDDYLIDTADAATAKFLRDQEERTRDLEEQLDAHILYLRQGTHSTVRKYVTAH